MEIDKGDRGLKMKRDMGNGGFEMKREKGEGDHSTGRGRKWGSGAGANIRIRASCVLIQRDYVI